MADTTTAPEQVASQLSPTLLIGLGGTGKDVLLRVRRRFFERYGRRADGALGFPIVGYLALDTDPGAFDRLEGEGPSDFVLRNIQFKRGGTPEAIDCTVEPRQLEDYFRGGEQSYPHLFRWLPPGLKRFGANGIVGGAGQNRLFGRLAFFHHFHTIRAALKARIHQLVADATLPERRDVWLKELRRPVRVNTRRLEIVLVYSLAGGTGAGMFLDAAMLVRHLVERELALPEVQPFLTHFAVLPEAFVQEAAEGSSAVVLTPDQRRKVQENAYACLREMEFFSMRPGRMSDLSLPPPVPVEGEVAAAAEPWHRVQWELDGPFHEVHSAPWDTCYLIGAGNDAMGNECLPPPEVYQTVADRLCLMFDGGQFATREQSERSNLVDRTLSAYRDPVRNPSKEHAGDVLYSHYLSKRFSAFGLAEIYFDRERMRRAAGHRLAHKLVSEWWLRAPDRAPVEVARLAAEDVAGAGGERPMPLTYSAIRDQILLENRDADRHRTWFRALSDEADARRRDVEAGRHDNRPLDAVRPYLDLYNQRLRRERHSKGETGLAVRSYEKNRQHLEAEIDARLRALVVHRLETLGVRGAIGVLDEYANLYKGELGRVQHMEEITRAQPPLWEDRILDAARLPLLSYARTAVRLELLRALRSACDYLQKTYHHEAIPDIRICLERVQRQVAVGDRQRSYGEALRRGLDVLAAQTDTLTGVQHYLARRFEELREPARSLGRTIGLLDHLSDEEYDAAIRPLVAPPGRSEGLDMLELGPEVERRVLEQLRATRERWKDVGGFGELLLTLAGEDELPPQPVVDEFARDLAEACEALLGGFAANTSALQQFQREVAEKKTRLECLRIYSGCYLRMARTGDILDIDTPPVRRLGVARSKGAEAEAFRRELEAGAGNNLLGLQPFELSDDRVVVYQEKTGLPLCCYQGLEEMARVYYGSHYQPERHLDYAALRGRLPDIRRVNQERQKHLAGCLKLTLYGVVTGVLAYARDRQRECFWLRSSGLDGEALPLGEQFESVVHHLAEHREDRLDLTSQLEIWFRRAAARNEGEQIVLLWCALQDLHQTVRERVAYHASRLEGPAQQEARNHPLYRILADEMLPEAYRRVQGLPGAAVWLGSKLDLAAIGRELEGEERAAARAMRRELLADCLRPVHEGLPIPVIRLGAGLEEKVFGDLTKRKTQVAAPAKETPRANGEERAAPFRFAEDYDGLD